MDTLFDTLKTEIDWLEDLAKNEGWNNIRYHVENDYPNWKREDVKYYNIDKIPNWVRYRLNKVMQEVPVMGTILLHEPQPTFLTKVDNRLGMANWETWQKVLAYAALAMVVTVAAVMLAYIIIAVAVIALACMGLACSSGDPACVVIVDDGTPNGVWVEIGRWYDKVGSPDYG